MKIWLVLFMFATAANSFALSYQCQYETPQKETGRIGISIYQNNRVEVHTNRKRIRASRCRVERVKGSSNIVVECDKSNNKIGLKLEDISGKLIGVFASDRAKIFGEVVCQKD